VEPAGWVDDKKMPVPVSRKLERLFAEQGSLASKEVPPLYRAVRDELMSTASAVRLDGVHYNVDLPQEVTALGLDLVLGQRWRLMAAERTGSMVAAREQELQKSEVPDAAARELTLAESMAEAAQRGLERVAAQMMGYWTILIDARGKAASVAEWYTGHPETELQAARVRGLAEARLLSLRERMKALHLWVETRTK
jgi:hypothetical protein